jgi:uncharacterized protein with GYD domain
VAVYAAHAGFVVAQPFGFEHVDDLVFVHPHLVAVLLAVRSQALDDRRPRSDSQVFARYLAGTRAPVAVALVRDHQAVNAARECTAADCASGGGRVADEPRDAARRMGSRPRCFNPLLATRHAAGSSLHQRGGTRTPIAGSNNAGPALTSAFGQGDDEPGFGSNQRGWRMPTYVSLIHWTDQGVKNYKDSTSRAADFTKLAESSGGRVRELLWTVGEYDIVTVVDFPDDETATAALLRVGSLGNIRSNTLRAFNAEEIGVIFERAG